MLYSFHRAYCLGYNICRTSRGPPYSVQDKGAVRYSKYGRANATSVRSNTNWLTSWEAIPARRWMIRNSNVLTHNDVEDNPHESPVSPPYSFLFSVYSVYGEFHLSPGGDHRCDVQGLFPKFQRPCPPPPVLSERRHRWQLRRVIQKKTNPGYVRCLDSNNGVGGKRKMTALPD